MTQRRPEAMGAETPGGHVYRAAEEPGVTVAVALPQTTRAVLSLFALLALDTSQRFLRMLPATLFALLALEACQRFFCIFRALGKTVCSVGCLHTRRPAFVESLARVARHWASTGLRRRARLTWWPG